MEFTRRSILALAGAGAAGGLDMVHSTQKKSGL